MHIIIVDFDKFLIYMVARRQVKSFRSDLTP